MKRHWKALAALTGAVAASFAAGWALDSAPNDAVGFLVFFWGMMASCGLVMTACSLFFGWNWRE